MFINLNEIPEQGLYVEFIEKAKRFPVLNDMSNNNECTFISPLLINLYVQRIGEIYEVNGTIEVDVLLSCSRCLESMQAKLKNNFELTYTRKPQDAEPTPYDEEIELHETDLGIIWFKGERIDVREAIQEQVVLMIPQKPLCFSECKGLCQTCGENLNNNQCECEKKKPLSRFGELISNRISL
ncbi:MAG: DUF177 domain-containing protein [Desulfobacterales bacterium]|nr:DUF177 domain-containing protein [Desulfobacterales bacterium]